MYKFIRVCVCVCVCIYIYICMCVYVCVCVYIYVCVCMYLYIYVYVCIYICVCVCIFFLGSLSEVIQVLLFFLCLVVKNVLHTSPSAFNHFAGCPQGVVFDCLLL